MAKRQGGGNYLFESVDNWCKIDIPGVVSDVATDSNDNVYLAVRTAQAFDDNTGAILAFDRDGNHPDFRRCPRIQSLFELPALLDAMA